MNKRKLYKGHITIYIVLILAVIVVMFMLRQCSTKVSPNSEYKRAGGDTINVAIEISPLSLSMAGDSLGGFNYELLKLISDKYGAKFKFHEFVPLNYALKGIDNNMFDVVVADIPATTILKESYLLTEPVYIDRQVLVQLNDPKTGLPAITEHRQLASDSIWVVAQSPFIDRIQNLAKEMGCDTIYIMQDAVYSSEQLIILTALGEIKQAVVNEKIAQMLAKDYPNIDINTKISFSQFQSWVVSKKNQALAEKLNKWIIEIKELPEYEILKSKYFK